MHWWIATDDSEYPNEKIVVHLNEMRTTDEGARRGWVTVPDGNRIADAHCSVLFAPNVDTTDPRELSLVPFIGQAHADRDLVLRCDTGSDDNGDSYRGRVQTKPFINLLNQRGVMAGSLLAKADAGETVYVRAVRDFGLETKTVDADLDPASTEAHVIKPLDDLSFSELFALQLELGDLDEDEDPADAYELNGLALKVRGEGRA